MLRSIWRPPVSNLFEYDQRRAARRGADLQNKILDTKHMTKKPPYPGPQPSTFLLFWG